MRFAVPVLVETLGDGSIRMAPIAERRWLTCGRDRASAQAELTDALLERLHEMPPERVAALTTLSPGARVASVVAEVALPYDADESLPIAFHVVVLPDAAGEFVLAPTLEHALFVRTDEVLAEVAALELARVARARVETGRSFLSLFPADDARLDTITIDVPRVEEEDEASRVAGAKNRAEQTKKREATAVLAGIGRRLVRDPTPVLGRERVTEELAALLRGKERRGVVVTGPELSGKTTVILALVSLGFEVHAVSAAELLAGTGGPNAWQQRVEEVVSAAERLDLVLYLEDAAGLLTDRPESPIDLASAIAPLLDARRVRFVTEARDTEVDRIEGRHARLSGALLRLRVEPLGVEDTLRALTARGESLPETKAPRLTTEAMQVVVRLCRRYARDRALPGEAVRLFDQVRQVEETIRDEAGRYPSIDERRVLDAFARRTGLPAALLRADVPLRRDEIEAFFAERIVGQERAVRAVAEALAVVKSSLASEAKPIATFLFVGPTGVGKTEVARALGLYLFGRESALTRFDMSEYGDPFAGDRLVRGNDREDGLLTRAVRRAPFSVILLDEIEKAHPSVFDVLLSVLGEGRLSDARGRLAHFHNCIVVMTSNVGTRTRRTRTGFGAEDDGAEAHYVAEVERTFRPELVNRIDRIVAFETLDAESVSRVASIALARLPDRAGIRDRRIALDVDAEAARFLAERGTRPADGARALRRTLEDDLVAPLARTLSRLGAKADRAQLSVRLAEGELRASVAGQRARRVEGGMALLESIAERRRNVERWLRLDPFTDAVERVERLTSDLHRLSAKDTAEARSMVGALATDLARQERPVRTMQSRAAELAAIEELALTAYLDEQPVDGLRSDVDATEPALHRAMLDVLRQTDTRGRERWDLVVTGVGTGASLRFYLLPLLDELEQRGCRIAVHAPRDKDDAALDWPRTRPWGPPRSLRAIRETLAGTPSFTSVHLVVESREHAFVLVDEEGPHALVSGDRREATVVVTTPTQGVASDGAQIPRFPTAPDRAATRTYDARRGVVWTAGSRYAVECDLGRWATRLDTFALIARVTELQRALERQAATAKAAGTEP
jgi:ATP-dependent Clp protease ATP-binding subunit ClpC